MKTWIKLVTAFSVAVTGACSQDEDPSGSAGGAQDAVTADASGTSDVPHSGTTDTTPGEDGDGAGNGGGAPDTSTSDAGPSDTGSATTDTGGPGDTGAPDSGPDVSEEPDVSEGPDVQEPGTGFDSAEMMLRIIGPSPHDWAQSATPYLNLNGVLFGHADSITWILEESGATGEITVGAFWYAGGIQLQEGTNTISVIASSDTSVATDQIKVVHNPTFAFDGPPRLLPPALFVGESTQAFANIRLSTYKNFDPNTVQLHMVDANGELMETKGPMKDNGNTASNCDEVDKDGLFSACLTLNVPTESCVHVRASVQATVGFQKYEAWSPTTKVCAVPRITPQTCQAVQTTQKDAKAQYLTLLQTSTPAQAQAALIEDLLKSPDVAEAGPATDGYGVWILYANGLLGALDLSPEGLRGGGWTTIDSAAVTVSNDVGSKEATILAPFKAEFGDQDEAMEVATVLKAVGCPFFGVSAFQNDQASLYRFRHMNDSGIVAISSHGDTYFGGLSAGARAKIDWDHDGSQEVIWTGEKIDCTRFMQAAKSCANDGLECENGAGECLIGKSKQCVDFKQHDLRRGRVIFGDEVYGIVPDFVTHHAAAKPYSKAVVYLGACRTLWNGGFAAAFFGAGAQTVLGYTDYVTSQFAHDRGLEFFQRLITDKLTAAEAYGEGASDTEAGGEFRLFGAGKATARDGSIVNPSFEAGNLTAWSKDGDGRVISQLGQTVPVDGKFMGLVSSGLGFTQEIGVLTQKFCIEAGKSTASFYWKYYSEEFLEFCGSGYQDPFQASLASDIGKITLVDVKINDLCPPNQCGGCGGKYVGLEPSDVSFDQGDVYNTQWQLAQLNISALTAITGPVTIKFFITDAGDSIYDTVVLIDKIDFK
ncbi:MAG: hypothetical protein AMXMBFR64_24490 [Myxococcales bacterium]